MNNFAGPICEGSTCTALSVAIVGNLVIGLVFGVAMLVVGAKYLKVGIKQKKRVVAAAAIIVILVGVLALFNVLGEYLTIFVKR